MARTGNTYEKWLWGDKYAVYDYGLWVLPFPSLPSIFIPSFIYLNVGCLVLLTTGTQFSCACVRWACCDRNAVVPKPPGRACQEGGMHPSPFGVAVGSP